MIFTEIKRVIQETLIPSQIEVPDPPEGHRIIQLHCYDDGDYYFYISVPNDSPIQTVDSYWVKDLSFLWGFEEKQCPLYEVPFLFLHKREWVTPEQFYYGVEY